MWAAIRHEFPDGSRIEVEVGSEDDAYPDQLDQLVAEVVRVYGQVVTDPA